MLEVLSKGGNNDSGIISGKWAPMVMPHIYNGLCYGKNNKNSTLVMQIVVIITP